MEKEKKNIVPRLLKGQKALAKELGVSQQTISLWQSEGRFRDCFIRVGKKYIYNLDAIFDKFAG